MNQSNSYRPTSRREADLRDSSLKLLARDVLPENCLSVWKPLRASSTGYFDRDREESSTLDPLVSHNLDEKVQAFVDQTLTLLERRAD